MATNRKRQEEIPVQDWLEYKRKPTKAFQARVFAQYAYISRTIAYEFLHKKPHVLEIDDLVQAGNMGLLQSIERYNPESGVQFNTYATFRIRGSIVDQIHSVDWTPRPVRERIKKVLDAMEKLKRQDATHESDITAELISKTLATDKNEKFHLTTEEVEVVLQQLNKTYITHMEPEIMNTIEDESPTGKGNIDSLQTIMNMTLTDEEQQVIQLKYFGGFKIKEIAEKLNKRVHHVNVIEKNALAKLAKNLPHGTTF